MSSDDEDITRIEDLADFNHDEEDEEDIPSLEDMASEMGLSDLPDLPSENLGDPEEDFPTELPPEVSDQLEDQPENELEDEFADEFESSQFESSFDSALDENDSEVPSYDFSETSLEENEEFENTQGYLDEPEQEIEPEPETAWKPELTNAGFTATKLSSSQLTPEAELVPEEEPEFTKTEMTKTEIEHQPIESWKEPEPLEDLTHFAKEQLHIDYSAEGNPPFSIIVKNLRYYEDIEGILDVLTEFNLADNRESMRENLAHGQVLIPRLSEYVAIIICHKLRVFDCEILMGLTEEIHPPKSYESQDRGLITKKVLNQNKRHHFQAKDLLDNSLVMTTTLNQIEGHVVKKHIGVITHSTVLNATDLNKSSQLEDEIIDNIAPEDQRRISRLRLKRENYLASQSEPDYLRDITVRPSVQKQNYNLDSIYKDLLEEIRVKAIEEKANGVIGINFTITPISIDSYLEGGAQYQVVCSGNLVWLERN